ncbi:hypothetical protein OG883_25310 [Streptomyces sp. NBC_01142]|uniref:hypothetical protein n=1 Tax=Streptomyces sp. NBC_01142 TaxID=2975865 RepID=UPI0022533839|nr:hypothetical protein [Streptomyces sp. NBC_01142]MCX4823147.1 hypothetical protein [Streptomyces sp. NBC_01142]
MSWDPQRNYGAYGASGAESVYDANQANVADGTLGVHAGNGAYQDGGVTPGPPAVYHPNGDGAQAYDGYVDPAAAHGWQETAATGHGVVPDDVGHNDGSVFVDPSGRRSRLFRRAVLAAAALCAVFIAVATAGFFSSVPSGGPLPWRQQERTQKHLQKQEQDGSTTATDRPGSTAGPTAAPSATPGGSANPNPSASASKTGGESNEPTTALPTTTAASTTSAPGKGNSGDHPGRGQGSTKGPR